MRCAGELAGQYTAKTSYGADRRRTFEIAKAFFGTSAVMDVGGLPNFYRDKTRQYIRLTAVHDFAKGDGFFKAFGDAPMPSYTPYGITDILMLAGKTIIPSKLDERISVQRNSEKCDSTNVRSLVGKSGTLRLTVILKAHPHPSLLS